MERRSRRKGRRKYEKKSVGPGQFVLRSNAFIRRATQFFKRHWVVVRSVLIFVGCILLFMFIYSRTAGEEQLLGLRSFIASATGSILNLFSSDIQVVGTSISSPDFSMEIISACTGLVAMAIFTSAVLAYPCRLGKKAEGIALGIVGLFIFNLVRMISLFLLGSYFPDLFNTAHYIVGQSLIILLAIGLWLFWLEKRVHVTSR
jgi:exosortase/archaeosortase family protein